MDQSYEYVDRFDKYLLSDVEDYDSLKIYRFKDFDLGRMKELIHFSEEAFGEKAADVFEVVFQIYYGNVFLLKESHKNNKILGVAAFSRAWDKNKMAYLSDYAIAEEARGKSLGEKFLKIVLEDLKDQGFEQVRLTVDPDNEPAVSLYESLGFEKIEFVEDLYGEEEDRYIMELVL